MVESVVATQGAGARSSVDLAAARLSGIVLGQGRLVDFIHIEDSLLVGQCT